MIGDGEEGSLVPNEVEEVVVVEVQAEEEAAARGVEIGVVVEETARKAGTRGGAGVEVERGEGRTRGSTTQSVELDEAPDVVVVGDETRLVAVGSARFMVSTGAGESIVVCVARVAAASRSMAVLTA